MQLRPSVKWAYFDHYGTKFVVVVVTAVVAVVVVDVIVIMLLFLGFGAKLRWDAIELE